MTLLQYAGNFAEPIRYFIFDTFSMRISVKLENCKMPIYQPDKDDTNMRMVISTRVPLNAWG